MKYQTNKAIIVNWSNSCTQLKYEFHLPKGLRCQIILEGGTKGKFFLDEFPKDIFPPNSFERDDAIHYGVIINPEDVEFSS